MYTIECHRLLISMVVFVWSFTLTTQAAVWQWCTPVAHGVDKRGNAQAYLWIPPDCDRVRGVVLAQHNMEEISILENAFFRQGLRDLNFAAIWCGPAFDFRFNFDQDAGQKFNVMMQDLAEVSGYTELTYVPVVGIGHSAAASWPYYFAVWNPERTLAAISVSGQWPYVRNIFAPDIWNGRSLDDIPCLETMGEYESALTWSAEGLKERQQYPHLAMSMLACPAEGHFASTDKKIDYLIFYLKKAVEYRIPREWDAQGPVDLISVDPTQTGWLKDKWRGDEGPTAPAAPVGQYTGDPCQAFWYFDEETVRFTEAYESQHLHKNTPLLGYVQEGKVVPQRDSHLQVHLKFLPEFDGVTFRLTGTFLDTVPGESGRPANWTGLPIGSPVGNPGNPEKITIDPICGPVVKKGSNTFQFSLRPGLGDGLKNYELYFAATCLGNHEYKPAVQQAVMVTPLINREGQDQRIIFPPLADQALGTTTVKLHATSSADVPVYYYIQAGPAMIEGDTLTFTPIPPRSRFPVRVTVVAWQYGRSVEPKLKTAASVERSFWITKNLEKL